ncbi:hypothetical protein [Agrococcus sp. SCSIO52902]|uniref:hypothetical protein n=1 Tax=Agrococcus sp. SCSIO52902 TaxID=2933290 RepID=UPI001FF3FF48|nr:hypothetical protein [Agrococcus sp. SCSIO52902]UOW01617.1 hypothetical protein MU522_04185 [Agrococcus sp. SCSIO52902]
MIIPKSVPIVRYANSSVARSRVVSSTPRRRGDAREQRAADRGGLEPLQAERENLAAGEHRDVGDRAEGERDRGGRQVRDGRLPAGHRRGLAPAVQERAEHEGRGGHDRGDAGGGLRDAALVGDRARLARERQQAEGRADPEAGPGGGDRAGLPTRLGLRGCLHASDRTMPR